MTFNNEEELNKLFPKGDEARGRALALYGIMTVKNKKFVQEKIDELELKHKNCDCDICYYQNHIIEQLKQSLGLDEGEEK